MVQRPLSPHLQVYKPQVTSVMSILHRMTGIAAVLGLLLISVVFVAAPYGAEVYERTAELVFSLPGKIILTLFAAAVFYHFLNGLRHLFWDTGRGLDIASIRRSAIVVVLGTAVLCVLMLLAGGGS